MDIGGFIVTNQNINMVRGDTLAFGVVLDDLDQDLDSAFFTIKETHSSDEYVVQKSLNNGITKLETGKYSVRVAPEDTKSLVPKKYYYDLQIGANGDIFTIIKGVIEIEREVTEV